MRLVEPWFGQWDDEMLIWRVLSVEFEIEPKIYTVSELEQYIRDSGDSFRVEIRYADELYGNARRTLEEVLKLFAKLKNELGDKYFNYILLPREQVTLDFCACKYIGDVFKEMRIKMEWDSWYGENLDALWDILTGLPHKGDDFTIIRPKRFVGIPHGENATFTKYVDKICSIFQEAQEQGDLTVQIEYIENKSSKDNSVYMV